MSSHPWQRSARIAAAALVAAAAAVVLLGGAAAAESHSHAVKTSLMNKTNCGWLQSGYGTGAVVGSVVFNTPNAHAAKDLTVGISTSEATTETTYDVWLAVYAEGLCTWGFLGTMTGVTDGVGTFSTAVSVGQLFDMTTTPGEGLSFEVVLEQHDTGTVLYATDPTPVTLNA